MVKACVIDFETTGLSGADRAVTFAAVRLGERGLDDEGCHFVFNPGVKSHWRARQVHGWSDDVLARQEPFAARAEEIRAAIEPCDLIVGHNLSFDLSFLQREFAACGRSIAVGRTFCTMAAYRSRWPGQKATLDCCLDAYGLGRAGRQHSALEDAALTGLLYRRMVLREPVSDDDAVAALRLATDSRPCNYRP